MRREIAIIIGAGPAGLTAAYELLKREDVRPIVYEMDDLVGGISRTINYKGNRIDIGGHRFFSRSARVVQWWLNILPLQGSSSRDKGGCDAVPPVLLDPGGPDPETTDRVMLVRKRRSRILYAGKLFDYPLAASLDTVVKLGFGRSAAIVASYLKARAYPIRSEKSLEDFFINRFGRALYGTFFRDYTEKLWGVPCDQLSPEWGVQRIKGLSVSKALLDVCRHVLPAGASGTSAETSLIRHFMYPKLGPGQLWSQVARIVEDKGGEIHLRHRIVHLASEGPRITGVTVRDETTGRTAEVKGSYFFSTMAIKDLVAGLGESAPDDVRNVARGLVYRDFITVGLLLKKLRAGAKATEQGAGGLIPDCWLYIHEPCVKMGRIQVFNNWSPYMVCDETKVWVGLEYFCTEGDRLWNMDDRDLTGIAVEEMARIGFIDRADVLDSTVIRMPKAYPAYTGAYRNLARIRDYTDRFENLFLVGRNGMHRYNNADHSMLSAMAAVGNIIHGVRSKDNIWAVNADEEYHEAAAQEPDHANCE